MSNIILGQIIGFFIGMLICMNTDRPLKNGRWVARSADGRIMSIGMKEPVFRDIEGNEIQGIKTLSYEWEMNQKQFHKTEAE